MYTKVYALLMDSCMHRRRFKAHENASASQVWTHPAHCWTASPTSATVPSEPSPQQTHHCSFTCSQTVRTRTYTAIVQRLLIQAACMLKCARMYGVAQLLGICCSVLYQLLRCRRHFNLSRELSGPWNLCRGQVHMRPWYNFPLF